VIGHHIWLARADGKAAWQDRIKRFVLRFGTHVAPSRAIADALPVPCTVVGNPYRDDLFVEDMNATRSRDLVFLGRLVSDKGADLLLTALKQLGRAVSGRQRLSSAAVRSWHFYRDLLKRTTFRDRLNLRVRSPAEISCGS